MRHAHLLQVGLFIFTYCAMTLSLTPPPAKAFWDYGANPVSTEAGNQEESVMVSDGDGGFIVVWLDSRFGTDEAIYAQRFDANGNALWAEDGVPVCTISGMKGYVDAIADGSGGMIVAWSDYRGAYSDLYAQRLNSSGVRQWNIAGLAVCTATGYQSRPALAPDGAGGVIVAWEDSRSGAGTDIYVRKIDPAGSMPWPTVWGELVCGASESQVQAKVLTDNAGGAYIAWEDRRADGIYGDIYRSHVDSDGTILVLADGMAVCTESSYQEDLKMIPVGSLYYAIVWRDYRSFTYDLYLQLYQGDGAKLTTNGVQICNPPSGNIYEFDVIYDGQDGLIVCWEDSRVSGTDYNLYVQRYNFDAGPEWTSGGVPICTLESDLRQPLIVSDMAGGAIISWYDYRASYLFSRRYAQRVDGSGNVLWETGGVKVCGERTYQSKSSMMSDGTGGAFIVMEDKAVDGSDLYAQRIDRNGYIASPEPSIYAAEDVPNDQGGQIELSWYASALDPVPHQEITHYTIWKSLTAEAAALLSAEGARTIDGFADMSPTGAILADDPMSAAGSPAADPDRPVIRIETLSAGTYFWELIDSQTAQYYTQYSKVVETDFTCTTTVMDPHYFQVAAHTADPLVVFTSAPDSGCAWDDLSPAPPVGLEGEHEYTPEGLQLTWDANTEPDIGGYLIYRGLSETFEPGSTSFVASVVDTVFFDGDWEWEDGYWYKIAAYDIHDNVSGYTLLGPSELTGEELPGVPKAAYLSQNYPNPFNPVTTIRFGLSAEAHVSLRIYDTAGRLVRVVLDEDRSPGNYRVEWDGLTSLGQRAASGVYFYKLSTESFTETRKMVLLK